ncbi:MAG: hypothetical protein QM723_07745 [Myxococcaceae bacterium]
MCGLLATSALANETTMAPKDTFVLDFGYINSTLDKAWDGNRHAISLIDSLPRYEPGGGLQGILSAQPHVEYQLATFQVAYGLFDWLMLVVAVPMVIQTTIDANFQWTPGDYQSSLGRRYSMDDFWAWAASMGQPRPPDHWVGNRSTMADMVIGARAKIPDFSFLQAAGLRMTGTLLIALPTGRDPAPEELVTAGTTSWDLHAYGDVEAHLNWDRPFMTNDEGISRFNVGGDIYYAFFRPRTLTTPTGKKNPLILDYAPYVGSTYTIDPGDWFGVGISADWAMFDGPTLNTWLSRKAGSTAGWPALFVVTVGYTYIATGQTTWTSSSALWDWEREKRWQPGDKNLFKFIATLSLLRVGLPLQLYAMWRSQDFIPGRYTRPAEGFTCGLRVIAKFW